ncbi:glycosyltransferase family 9 protein [bacterium]|nr:glycosyltransferase family 9 protein [candidate division CSSED10-310 bacterium]
MERHPEQCHESRSQDPGYNPGQPLARRSRHRLMSLFRHHDEHTLPDLNGKRILAIRFRSIGDALLMTPALHAIKHRFPEAELDVLVERSVSGILQGNPDVHEILIAVGKRDTDMSNLERRKLYMRTLGQIRTRHYSAVFDFHGGPRSGILTWLSGARFRVGHAEYEHGWAYTHLVDTRLPRDATHCVIRQIALVEGVGIRNAGTGLELAVLPAARAHIGREYPEIMQEDALVVTMHLWSGTPKKTWLPDYIARTADYFAETHGAVIVFIGGSSELDVALTAANRMQTRPILLLGGTISLPEIAAVLDRAAVHIGNDSGPTHMAAARGTPTVVLFGGSNFRVWHPWGNRYRILHRPQPCAPCRGKTPCEREFACIRTTTPEQVIAAAEELMNPRSLP